jgi:hypothetical protein
MQSLLDPAILFFVFGALAGLVKSNLEIPPQISRFLSLYLLMALGLKGGFAIAHSGFTVEVGVSLLCAMMMAVVVPLLGYLVLHRWMSRFDAAAIAATYGSVSAVTFITATQFLDNHGIEYGGHMAAAMALMESPAIIMAVLLANLLRQQQASISITPGGAAVASHGGEGVPLKKILHESFTDGAQLLLLGAMIVGLVTGDAGKEVMAPFSADLFKGMLAFFLLDMGLMAARNFPKKGEAPPAIVVYALLAPLVHAALALGLASLADLSTGNTALLMVLSASASYIAVPAVVRHAIPEANPSLYFGMSLGITFPFNIILGIPLYVSIASTWAA